MTVVTAGDIAEVVVVGVGGEFNDDCVVLWIDINILAIDTHCHIFAVL